MEEYFNEMGRITGDFGDRRITQLGSGRVRGGLRFTQACNTLFQGKTSDGAKEALWLITLACYDEPKSPLYGSRPVNFVHDEFILEAPIKRWRGAAEELARLAIKGMRKHIPDLPVQSEPYAMRWWDKRAEQVRDDNGRLQIWMPSDRV
jgi:DNA polymerase I-like protein with 3'-5' exonuclease and polymerase domains